MGLPLYDAQSDPGPSFFHYAESAGIANPNSHGAGESAHATTVIAVRYDEGVVMVGDRQATGQLHRQPRRAKDRSRRPFHGPGHLGYRGEGHRVHQDGPALVRALREDDRLRAQPRGQGQLPVPDHPAQQSRPRRSSSFRCWRVGTRVTRSVASSSTTEPEDVTSVSTSRPSARALPSPRAHSVWAIARTLIAKGRSHSGRSHSTRRATTIRAPVAPDFVRNLYPMIVTIDENGFQELASDEVGVRFREINDRRTQSGGVAGGSLR